MTSEGATPIETRLRAWATVFAHKYGLASSEVRINPPLHDDETAGLALALSSGLVDIEADGTFRVIGAEASKGPYKFFSRGPQPALNREYLIQLVAFTELVLHHNWPARMLSFEYDALDIVAFDAHRQTVVAVEAKRDAGLLSHMLNEMEAATPEVVAAAGTNAVRKIAALARLRPAVFVAVAPGVRRAFDVRYADTVPRLTSRSDVPSGPRGPLTCRVCGSDDDVRGEPEREGVIPLHCLACGHRWSRVPRRPCPRCASTDVEMNGYEGWAYEDPEAARETNWHDAEWHTVDWSVFRCRHCYNVWQTGHRG